MTITIIRMSLTINILKNDNKIIHHLHHQLLLHQTIGVKIFRSPNSNYRNKAWITINKSNYSDRRNSNYNNNNNNYGYSDRNREYNDKNDFDYNSRNNNNYNKNNSIGFDNSQSEQVSTTFVGESTGSSMNNNNNNQINHHHHNNSNPNHQDHQCFFANYYNTLPTDVPPLVQVWIIRIIHRLAHIRWVDRWAYCFVSTSSHFEFTHLKSKHHYCKHPLFSSPSSFPDLIDDFIIQHIPDGFSNNACHNQHLNNKFSVLFHQMLSPNRNKIRTVIQYINNNNNSDSLMNSSIEKIYKNKNSSHNRRNNCNNRDNSRSLKSCQFEQHRFSSTDWGLINDSTKHSSKSQENRERRMHFSWMIHECK